MAQQPDFDSIKQMGVYDEEYWFARQLMPPASSIRKMVEERRRKQKKLKRVAPQMSKDHCFSSGSNHELRHFAADVSIARAYPCMEKAAPAGKWQNIFVDPATILTVDGKIW